VFDFPFFLFFLLQFLLFFFLLKLFFLENLQLNHCFHLFLRFCLSFSSSSFNELDLLLNWSQGRFRSLDKRLRRLNDCLCRSRGCWLGNLWSCLSMRQSAIGEKTCLFVLLILHFGFLSLFLDWVRNRSLDITRWKINTSWWVLLLRKLKPTWFWLFYL
jgi:hypothetical protein